jgi:hypothetical protein
VRGLLRLISSGNIASTPNNSWKGVKLVALQTMVLWLHTTLSMTFAHLPYFLPSSIFLMA